MPLSMSPRGARTARTSTILPKFELQPEFIGRPRLNNYHKLLSRFYEVLVLLQLLGQSRGAHKPKQHDLDKDKSTRREFLRNLCYICDFDKGGDSCTAIGLEELETRYRFWVASNKGTAEITRFLENALELLRNIDGLSKTVSAQKKTEFSKFCIEFGKKRIAKEKRCLYNAVAACQQKLLYPSTTEAKTLSQWLSLFLGHDNDLTLCTFAYETRHSEFIPLLQIRSMQQKGIGGPESEFECFTRVKHLIGRLAHRIRASNGLFEAAIDVSYILETFEVLAVKPLASVPPPEPDRHTNLGGILNRMLGKNCNERLEVEHGLFEFNAVTQIFEEFPGKYRDIKPRIHAEVQILEHFHRNQMLFANNDRYIACSKPACLCCEMYFKYHPARMVVPESHQNVWTNWGPPLVENFSKFNTDGRQQLDLMNKMIHGLRELVIGQALGQSSAGHRHPDSQTGITELHSGSSALTITILHQEHPLIDSKDAYVDRQNSKVKNESGVRTNGFDILRDIDEQLDLEGGGVSIYA